MQKGGAAKDIVFEIVNASKIAFRQHFHADVVGGETVGHVNKETDEGF